MEVERELETLLYPKLGIGSHLALARVGSIIKGPETARLSSSGSNKIEPRYSVVGFAFYASDKQSLRAVAVLCSQLEKEERETGRTAREATAIEPKRPPAGLVAWACLPVSQTWPVFLFFS